MQAGKEKNQTTGILNDLPLVYPDLPMKYRIWNYLGFLTKTVHKNIFMYRIVKVNFMST